ncbi:hypothetical protein C4K03_3721 [Pseudomonas synxantha]|uniref:Phage tail fiber protein n=1 Tax=Pseudomonas synxantha TaxID=47883 RepID=A0A3G7U923_9PSED|nr:hypothetical protein [Pseudomonas synxantha]AZE55874.1 hypothetical protein C4K03_3721 [Pseudomonas synxantha]
MSSWFAEGTVTVTNGNAVVTGVGTKFSNCRSGDMFVGPDNGIYQVINPSSDTSVSISPAYRGATSAGAAYGIVPVNGYPKALADAVNLMVQQWGATLAGLGTVSTENVVPVAKGGTGGTTQAAARSGLGLGTAAVATLGTATGNAMPVGAFGLGAQSAPVSPGTFLVGFSVTSGGDASQTPSTGSGGSRITMNTGGLLFNEIVIAANSATSPTLGYRQFNSNGVPGPWNVVYTNQNTTRAQDGTLKAI